MSPSSTMLAAVIERLPRQQIVPTDGKEPMTAISEADLQTEVANHLYPDGITSEAEYNHVVDEANALAQAAGFLLAVTLKPPQVPFGKAGVYLQQLSPLTKEAMTAIVKPLMQQDMRAPLQTVTRRAVIRQVINSKHACSHIKLKRESPDVYDARVKQIDAFFEENGWQCNLTHEPNPRYERQIKPNLAGLQESLSTYLEEFGTSGPILRNSLIREATDHVFGQSYPLTTIAADVIKTIDAAIADVLKASGYETVAKPNGHGQDAYHPKPVELPTDIHDRLQQAFANLPRYRYDNHDLLLEDDVRHLAEKLLNTGELKGGAWQQVKRDHLNPLLLAAQFKTHPRTIFGDKLEPQVKGRRVRAFFSQFAIEDGANHLLSIGRYNDADKPLPVLAPICVLDDETSSIICLQLIGPYQSVKANWAKLASGRKQWVRVDNVTIRQQGMKQHVLLKRTLPVGYVEWMMLHKQASLKEMNPADPAYVIDDRQQEIPPLFFPMLDKALSIPLQPQWAPVLWREGQAAKLIRRTRDRGIGAVAWVLENDHEAWAKIIEAGFARGELTLMYQDEVVTEVAQTDAVSDVISTYTVDDGIEDSLLADVADSYDDPIASLASVKSPHFPLGRLVVTQGVLELAEQGISLVDLLNRHASKDWGDLENGDKRANNRALKQGDRLFSCYNVSYVEPDETTGELKTIQMRIYIITEWNRSVTTLLLPSEY